MVLQPLHRGGGVGEPLLVELQEVWRDLPGYILIRVGREPKVSLTNQKGEGKTAAPNRQITIPRRTETSSEGLVRFSHSREIPNINIIKKILKLFFFFVL